MKDPAYILEMIDIVKEFPGVRALKGVQLKVAPGEIHGLVGENGAGKSTLVKCLMGIYKPTSGTIIFDGQRRENYSVSDALKFGVSIINQELSPVLHRQVMSNIWLGREPRKKTGLIDWKLMDIKAKEYLTNLDLDIDTKEQMIDLSVAEMQMIEITRAVSCDAKLIIMDEPTAALTNKEVDQLFKIMSNLKKRGVSIIYISHRLDEIYQIADRISVFRDGEYIATKDTDKLGMNELINMMVGREMSNMFPEKSAVIGDKLLEVHGFSDGKRFNNISFSVRKGEIFGIAGLVGAGRTELIESIFGIRPKTEGEIFLNGEKIIVKDSGDAINKGFALLTEERRQNGIFPVLNIIFNMTIAHISHYSKYGIILKQKMVAVTEKYIKVLNVKTPSATQEIQYLSGGNQQKVLIARWLLTEASVIFLDEPTRGIDVGAKMEIYKLIDELAASGKCIVMVSSELPEILGMSDRIMVMREGHIAGILDNKNSLTQNELLEYASGLKGNF